MSYFEHNSPRSPQAAFGVSQNSSLSEIQHLFIAERIEMFHVLQHRLQIFLKRYPLCIDLRSTKYHQFVL